MIRTILVLAGLAVLPGMGSANGDADGVSCGADAVQDMVGQPVAGVRDRLPETVRVISPGMAVTQDYRPERMNVDLDGAGTIVRIWCG